VSKKFLGRSERKRNSGRSMRIDNWDKLELVLDLIKAMGGPQASARLQPPTLHSRLMRGRSPVPAKLGIRQWLPALQCKSRYLLGLRVLPRAGIVTQVWTAATIFCRKRQ